MKDIIPTDTSERVLWLLKRAFHSGHRAVNDSLRSFGITPTQLGVLNRLSQEPGLSGADLARRLLVTPQAAQLALSGLEEKGWVRRRPDPNHGRIVRSHLTASGKRIWTKCLERSLRAEDEFLSILSPAETTALAGYLERLTHQIVGHEDDGAPMMGSQPLDKVPTRTRGRGRVAAHTR